MDDQLKKHIDINREEFEIYETDFETIWSDVETKLPGDPNNHKDHSLKYVWVRSAAMLALAAFVSVFLIWQGASNDFNVAVNKSNWKKVAPELVEVEGYYSVLINEKLQILKASNSDAVPSIIADLKELDVAFKELKNDLKDQANNEEVVNAMIRHYRIKLQILEEVLEEIQSKKNENNSDEENHMAI